MTEQPSAVTRAMAEPPPLPDLTGVDLRTLRTDTGSALMAAVEYVLKHTVDVETALLNGDGDEP